MPAVMYILECSDGSYYVGSTTDLEQRLKQHESGRGCAYTAARLPFRLVYSEEYLTREDAAKRERQLKGWSRCKKEALIRGCFEDLRNHSTVVYPERQSKEGSLCS